MNRWRLPPPAQPITKSGYSPAISTLAPEPLRECRCLLQRFPADDGLMQQHVSQHRAEGVLLGPARRGGHFHRFRDTCTCVRFASAGVARPSEPGLLGSGSKAARPAWVRSVGLA
jgi:hypothetical protein